MDFALSGQRGFGSDNHSGVHPEILAAITAANTGHAPAYGTDPISEAAYALFREHFGDVSVFFVFGGTAANVLALATLAQPFEAILCSDCAHIQVDECGAPERFIGAKLLLGQAPHGKLHPDALRPHLIRGGDQHFAQPRVLSITQPTELGTVYSLDELRALAAFAQAHHLKVHMDGARLVNAAAALDVPLRDIVQAANVDVLSFGGTKNGLLMGEAVVFFNKDAARTFKYTRKQGMQLPSKMRFVAAQFCAFLGTDLWRRNALHANAMAQALAAEIRAVPGVQITQAVDANAVFARLPAAWVKPLRERAFFYIWDEHTHEARFMTTFDTELRDITAFGTAMRSLAARQG